MATAASARLSAERRFYSWMAVMMIVVVLIGFAPSFYLRGIVPSYPRPNPSLPPSVLLHGIQRNSRDTILISQFRAIPGTQYLFRIKYSVVV